MPSPIAVLSLAGLLFVVSLTPGPAAAYCIAVGMEEEGRSALWAPVGISLGKVVHLAAAAAGAAWINDLPTAVRVGVLVLALATSYGKACGTGPIVSAPRITIGSDPGPMISTSCSTDLSCRY